jgi:hypothetical protein
MSNRKWIGAGYYSRERAREVASQFRKEGNTVIIKHQYGAWQVCIKRED